MRSSQPVFLSYTICIAKKIQGFIITNIIILNNTQIYPIGHILMQKYKSYAIVEANSSLID